MLKGPQDRGWTAVAIQGLAALRGVPELGRKVRETGELESRTETLERHGIPREWVDRARETISDNVKFSRAGGRYWLDMSGASCLEIRAEKAY